MRKIIIGLVAVGLAAVFLASCGSDSDSDDSTSQPQILRLGVLLPTTGSFSSAGVPMIAAARMAVSEITMHDNTRGGRRIELTERESGTNPTIANSAVDNLLALETDAIVGASTSGVSLSILDKVAAAGVVQIAPSNSSPTFTDFRDDGYYFRTLASDVLWIENVGERLQEQNAQSVAVIFRDDNYGVQIAGLIRSELEAEGIELTDFISYDEFATEFSEVISRVRAVNGQTDAYIISSFEEIVPLLREMTEAGISLQEKQTLLTVAPSLNLGEQVNPNNPGVVEGVEGVEVAAHPQAEQTFFSRLQDFAPSIEDATYAPFAYDAVVILTLASLVADSTDPADFRTEINDVTRGGTKCRRYDECAQLIREGQDIDYDGASGPLEFSDVGEPTQAAYSIFFYDSTGTRQLRDELLVVSGN